MYRVSSCNVYEVPHDTRCFFMIDFIHNICQLYMFRTSQVHPQERLLQAVCADLLCGNTRTARYTLSSRYGVVGRTDEADNPFYQFC
jgi:hypothetical protein